MKSDVVYVRKSDNPQDEKSQIDDIRRYLDRNNIVIPERLWFKDTGSRHHHEEREAFQRMFKLIEQGKVSRVFCWKQNRIGTTNSNHWGHIRWVCECNGTKIIDTLTGKDLTADDVGTMIETNLAADTSRQDQVNISQGVQRKRVTLAQEGMPMSKYAPYGLDKMYVDSAGRHLWTTHLLDSGKWLVINPDGTSIERDASPRKAKSDRIVYIESRDKARVALVREMFRVYLSESISERGLCLRFNTTGRLHYGKPWLRTTVREILRNPAYMGTVRNMNITQAEFTVFDGEKLAPVTDPRYKKKKVTRPGVRILVADRHEAIIDPSVWHAVQAKHESRKKRAQPPRRDDLWLRGVLHCGTCRRAMHVFTGKGKLGYICGSYYRFGQTQAKSDYTGCGRNWISHDKAARLVQDKVGSDLEGSKGDRSELDLLRGLCGQQEVTLKEILTTGLSAYMEHVQWVFRVLDEFDAFHVIQKRIDKATNKGKDKDKGLQEKLDQTDIPYLRSYFFAWEEVRVGKAKAQVDKLKSQFNKWVESKVMARSDREREAINEKLAGIEAELAKWEGQTTALDDQLAEVRSRLAEYQKQLADAVKALDGSVNLRKAEHVRGLFSGVYLHFDKVKKRVYTDVVFRPELTEFVSSLPVNSGR